MTTELQNAFATSQAERHATPADTRVPEALAAGRFVLAVTIEAHCPRTDATLGFDRHFEGAFDTQAEALEALDALDAQCEGMGPHMDIIAPPVHGCEEAPSEPFTLF